LKQITSGLHLIHKKNVIHRDVTPKNIFLTKGSENTTSIDDYDVKVGDLGLSIKIEELTKSIATDGTLRYASPQQRNGKRYSTAADIWGLGCVAMEIITLLEHVDFYNELTKDVEWVRKTLAPFEQFYDEKLIQFVHRTLVIDQKDRATASELLSLLEEEEDNVVSDLENGENDIFPDEEGFPEDLENSSSNKHHSKVLNVGSFDSFVSEMDFEHKLRQEAVEQALSETSSTSSSTVKENHPFPVKVGFEQRLHVLLQKPLLTWTSSDVGLWLMCVDMGRYTENFVAQEMNGAAIKYMKMEHLSMVGVRTLGHQIQIYELIQQLIKYHQ
jgi:serine/threonine protein kinase